MPAFSDGMRYLFRYSSIGYGTYSAKEHWEALVNDGLDNHTVYVSKPDRHERANDKQDCQYKDVPRLATLPAGKHNLDQPEQAVPEELIDVTTTFLFVIASRLKQK